MSYYKFKSNDVFNNTIKTYPKAEFFIYEGRVYYNNSCVFSSGSHCDPPPPPPPVETFFILTEGGDPIITEGGDEIITE